MKLLLLSLLLLPLSLNSFSPSHIGSRRVSTSALFSTPSPPPSGSGSKKKRKRKRKAPSIGDAEGGNLAPPMAPPMAAGGMPMADAVVDDNVGPALKAVDLPSIKDSVSTKKTTEAATLAAEAEEDATPFTAVSRADAEGLKLLLQSDPTAFDPSAPSLPTKSKKKKGGNLNSGDFSTVSLLLGEGGSSFFSIPFQAIQVGHGILSLILLICLVDYPGFPLTNLPPEIREAIGKSWVGVYGINLGLAGWVYGVER
ncbi:hypothetical protein TL16_g06907 [Triparma laevis f. inornata]|uniref:Uncharacterized protein n=1 Tax=Triparma laevis f. inornata TaxID=1714386 RepID=A0A9W7AUT6_9STRA|nr:hypothetical protein TL16_g06907 [Triparma laevis f. inornata]